MCSSNSNHKNITFAQKPVIKKTAVRSFVLRQGRLTSSQKNAIDQYLVYYALDPNVMLNPKEHFSNDRPPILEVGFGNGQALLERAQCQPEENFIGIEIHKPGVGHLIQNLRSLKLDNIKIYFADALLVLEKALPPESLAACCLFFPDPWPKKRHHKRRIIQPAFIDLVYKALIAGGLFHMATDWEPYAASALELLSLHPGLENLASDQTGFVEKPESRPQTKFERRGQKLGHTVRDLIFKKVNKDGR